ncbi:MAG TPA: DUF6509 family protein [Chondromyces sp.]|nr:DUF6509 family protein [Chondromyces sp.]
MNITNFQVEYLEDPFGILSGDRYEFLLYVDIPEDDELYSELGVYIRVLYLVEEGQGKIVHYHIYERSTDRYLDFELEEEEVEEILNFCRNNLPEE